MDTQTTSIKNMVAHRARSQQTNCACAIMAGGGAKVHLLNAKNLPIPDVDGTKGKNVQLVFMYISLLYYEWPIKLCTVGFARCHLTLPLIGSYTMPSQQTPGCGQSDHAQSVLVSTVLPQRREHVASLKFTCVTK